MTDVMTPAEEKVRTARQLIGGEWVGASDGRLFDDRNPFNGELVARVPAGTAADAAAAIESAHEALPGWATTPPAEKQRLFLRAADVVEQRGEEMLDLILRETGGLPAIGLFQLDWSAKLLRQLSAWPYRSTSEGVPTDTPGTYSRLVRRPVGVVAAFTPWNAASVLAWRSIAAPLVCGNTVVLKPSEEAPITAGILLAEVLLEAGFPRKVIQVVTHAPGEAAPIADAFFESSNVPLVNFTGSTATGRMLAERAGKSMTRIVLELGGYNPAVVLDDAPMQDTVDQLAFSAFFHQGQICMNTRKVIVAQSRYDEFVERMVAKAGSIKVGDPADADSDIGPLINDRAVEGAHAAVDEAVAKGARVVAGGKSFGRCFEPTVLVDVPADARIYTHEVFAPILVIQPAKSTDDAIRIANGTPYGLTSAVFSPNLVRAEEVAARLQAGNVNINGPSMHDEPQFPMGGIKESGWHRFGSWADENFTDRIQITTHTQRGPLPF